MYLLVIDEFEDVEEHLFSWNAPSTNHFKMFEDEKNALEFLAKHAITFVNNMLNDLPVETKIRKLNKISYIKSSSGQPVFLVDNNGIIDGIKSSCCTQEAIYLLRKHMMVGECVEYLYDWNLYECHLITLDNDTIDSYSVFCNKDDHESESSSTYEKCSECESESDYSVESLEEPS